MLKAMSIREVHNANLQATLAKELLDMHLDRAVPPHLFVPEPAPQDQPDAEGKADQPEDPAGQDAAETSA